MLLRDIAAGKMSADTLFIWDGNLARAGAKIIYQRRAYVAALEEPLSRIHTGLSGGRSRSAPDCKVPLITVIWP